MMIKSKIRVIKFYLFISQVISGLVHTKATEPWSFIVLADWHGAESFSTKPGTISKAWKNSLQTIKHIKENYGGDLVMLPGDSNNGEWDTEEFINKINPSFTPEEAILEAGENCYSTVKNLFSEGGYDQILVTVGDHEIGGNPWQPGSSKFENLESYRKTFTEGFNKDLSTGQFLFTKSIGNAKSRPIGTPFSSTSYAYQHKNVLFVTVDAFHTVGAGKSMFIDKKDGRGGEGAITCTLAGDHLTWFENILIEANNISSIKHIFVQAHVPIIQPVRKISCTGQFFDRAENSRIWKLMRKYKVDIYFAGEVHANTVSKDPKSESNLIQIVARGNSFSNFLKVLVTDDAIQITSFNEIGRKPRFNNDYEVHGELTMYKWGEDFYLESSGILEVINFEKPLIVLDFEEIVPLRSRQVIGMDHNDSNDKLIASNITMRGIHCTDAMANKGSFGQLYDAQVANIDLVSGRKGNAGKFTVESRLAIYASGPHSGGNILSLGIWIKTSQQSSEMMLLHYGATYSGSKASKDILTLTLNQGVPNLYTSSKKRLVPIASIEKLNDGKWHHIAVSMPKKSCLLSEIIIYIDGKKISAATDKDENIFFVTSGRMSIGGFGYSSSQYESMFPEIKPYVGLLDDFQVWSRKIEISDLPIIKSGKTLVFHNRRECIKDDNAVALSLSLQKCSRKCLRTTECLGIEWGKTGSQFRCFQLSTSPKLGLERKRTKCGMVHFL